MKKAIFTLIGFLFFVIGFLSLVFLLIGAQFSFLTWIDAGGRLLGFVVRLLMVIGGIVMVIITRTDWDGERDNLANDFQASEEKN